MRKKTSQKDNIIRISAILDRLRPALQGDGGDIELVRLDARNSALYLRFVGMCSHCSISEITLRHLIEREVRAELPEIKKIISV